MITYICKYTPVELLYALGAQPEEPNDEVTDFADADALIHSSVCSHAKQLLTVLMQESLNARIRNGLNRNDSGSGEAPDCEKCDRSAGKSGREVVLTNCCDSIRRVYDTLMAEKVKHHSFNEDTGVDVSFTQPGTVVQEQKYPSVAQNENTSSVLETSAESAESAREVVRHPDEFMAMLDLPHNNTDYSVGTYTKELERLIRKYQVYSGHTLNRDRFLFEWRKSASAWKRLNETKEEFIAVIGARAGRGLLEMFESSLPIRIVDFTCGGVRMICDPPQNAEDLSMEELLRVYAKTLLSQIPCMRMQDISGRKILINRPNLRGIIYHTVRFCDYYSFEYAALCKEVSIPMLKLESDYTFQSEGQLSTRIEAFRESLGLRSEDSSAAGPGRIREAVDQNRHFLKEKAISGQDRKDEEKESSFMGKDNLNSNEVNNPHPDRTVPDADSVYIGIDSGSTSTNCVAVDGKGNILASEILRTGARAGDAAERAVESVRRQLGSRTDQIRRIMATGYGREFITIADGTKTEISCHAKGAHSINPEARTVIDIGGQDSKVICLDEDGNVTNFIMNDKCAAGTGRFLEMMSHTLEMDISEMAGRGIKWKKDLTISSVCTVFAESEVVSLIAENNDTDDIIHALAKSVASKTCSMVRRARGKGPFMMTGGVARNHAVTGEIEAKLGEKLYIGKEPDLTGAIGAALFAAEAML